MRTGLVVHLLAIAVLAGAAARLSPSELVEAGSPKSGADAVQVRPSGSALIAMAPRPRKLPVVLLGNPGRYGKVLSGWASPRLS